jgi:hypothetical protein
MKGSLKQIIGGTFGVVLFFLAVEHFTGFSTDLKTIFSGYTGSVKALEGR